MIYILISVFIKNVQNKNDDFNEISNNNIIQRIIK